MLALRLDDQRPHLDAHEPPPRRRAGEALIAVRLAGICDTDLQLVKGYAGYAGVLGHEFVGEVLQSDDPRLMGRRVVSDINAGCGACDDCRKRDGHHCAERTVLGIVGRGGALAEQLCMPERCLAVVPDGVSDRQAVFAEPLAAALHVMDALGTPQEGPVVVLGDGKLGLLSALALQASGYQTTLIGHHEAKLALAARVGCATMLGPARAALPERAAAVVEATGSAQGLAEAMRLVRPRGRIVLKTTVAQALTIDLAPAVVDELELVGSRCGDVRRAVEAMAQGLVEPTVLITETLPLSQGEQALRLAAERTSLKVLVQP